MNAFFKKVFLAQPRPMSTERWCGKLWCLLGLAMVSAFVSRQLPPAYGGARQFGIILASMLLVAHLSRWHRWPRRITIPLRLFAIAWCISGVSYMWIVSLSGK